MSPKQQAKAAQSTQTEQTGLLDQILDRMPKAVEKDRARDLVETLVREVSQGTVVWDRGLTRTINNAVSRIDEVISKQLAAIMHDPKFQQLEGSWRGLHHLVNTTETSAMLKLKVLNISKR